MTPEREEKFRRVASQRQLNLTVILENVHDPHNIGAVMRTCDAIGVAEIYVLYTDEQLTEETLAIGTRAAAGAKKWVDVHLFTTVADCFAAVKQKYDFVLSTHLAEDAKSLYELDLSQSVALLFGNERDGVSEESLAYSDGNFIIPQMGMVQSLNISVACAVTLYEGLRQRAMKGYYEGAGPFAEADQEMLYEKYYSLHEKKVLDKKESKQGLDF